MEENSFKKINEKCQEAWDSLDDISEEVDGMIRDFSDMVDDIHSEILELRLGIGGCLKILEREALTEGGPNVKNG